jgi:hypothetical protein
MTSERIGPYRVLSRRLDGHVERIDAMTEDGQRVLLRRRGAGRGARRPVAEAVAFARADHSHVATLVDVLTSPSGDLVLAFDDVGGDPLSSWLSARGRPEPGEVITLVVPVLGAVQHLARRGVALTDLGVDDVDVDARGAPMLVGVSPGLVSEEAEGASLSVAAAFARTIVERAAWPARGGTPPVLDETSFESLVESLFDLGEAVPLSSVDTPDGVDAVDPVGTGPRPGDETDGPVPPGWLALLPESDVIDRVAAWLGTLRPGGLVAGARLVRPRYRVLGAGAVVVAGAAVLLATSTDVTTDGATVSASDGSIVSTSPDERTDALERPETRSVDADAPTSETADPASTGDDRQAFVVGDDARAAAEVLLASRTTCLRDPTPSCLDAVDQPGSPIALRDGAVLDDPSRAGGLSVTVELTGDASGVGGVVFLPARGENGEPASVLVMRTEAGWRLRDVYVES